jgi:hypothetical protein
LWTEYRKMVKSDVADIKNTAGRSAGAITAGAFLGAFTNKYRWVHLDIAGIAWATTARPYLAQGATGAGVRVLAELLNTWKKPRGAAPKPGLRTSLGTDPDTSKGSKTKTAARKSAGGARTKKKARTKVKKTRARRRR